MLGHSYNHADEIFKSSNGHSVWIGDLQAAEDVAWLKQKNIKTVFTAASGFNLNYDPTIRQIKYQLQDKKSQNIGAYFDMAAFQIEKYLRMNSILVHCGAGVSRSPTLVIAYLIKYKGMTFQSALKYCKTKRPEVCPNLGFELQLKAYQKSHLKVQSSFGSHPIDLIGPQQKKGNKQLPLLMKYHQFQSTFSNPFTKIETGKHHNQQLIKSLKHQNNQKKQMEYLKKMAQFRFGITNMQRWRINGQPLKNTPVL